MYCHACHHQWQRDTSNENIECPFCWSLSTEIVCDPSSGLSATSLSLTAGSQITPENDPRHFHNTHNAAVNNATTPATHEESVRPDGEGTPATEPHGQDPAGSATASEAHDNSNNNNTNNNNAQVPQPEGGAAAAGSGPAPQRIRHEIRFIFPPTVTFITTVVNDPAPQPQAPTAPATGENPSAQAAPQAPHPSGPPPVTFFEFGFPLHFIPRPMAAPRAAPTSESNNTPTEAGNTTTQEQQQTGDHTQPQAQPRPPQYGPVPPPTGPAPMPGFVAALLSSIFNPAAAVLGDAVYSQEAFDRIMTQLREQQQPTGAPPASQAAIDKLQVRELDEKMLDTEGKARCVICVDEMCKGEQATVLPCNHFFHGECVTPWLKQHNTCPVCRRSVEEEVKPAAKVVDTDLPHPAEQNPHCETAGGGDCS